MDGALLELLVCPACRAELSWDLPEPEEGEARCSSCGAGYPVRHGVAAFLTPEVRRDDLWEEAEGALSRALRENPEVERELLGAGLERLAPADRFYRALALEERGDWTAAREAALSARAGLYTRECLECLQRQLNWVVDVVADGTGVVVDVASGRGTLVEALARDVDRPLVATDLSPRVLLRDRRALEAEGLAGGVSFVACDARRTPFRDGSVATLTTSLGLQSVTEPSGLLAELRRVADGALYAVAHFYPEEDDHNGTAVRDTGLGRLLYRRSALGELEAAGWRPRVENVCVGQAFPTPASELLGGAGIDALPVAETVLEWCVVVAEPAA